MLAKQSPNWEIYPSCDIALGEELRKHPEYPNAFIDVDVEATQKIIEELAPDSVGKQALNIELRPVNTLKAEGCMGYYRHKKPWPIPPLSLAMARARARARPHASPYIAIGVDVATAPDPLDQHPSAMAAENQTLVHELKHATDYNNSELRRKLILKQFWTGVVAHSMARVIMPLLEEGTGETSQQRVNLGNQLAYQHSEIERRARRAEATAHAYPPAIQLHSS